MKSRTVKELREIAKQRGMRGYSALRKADLIAVLTSGGVIDHPYYNLLDEQVPAIQAPVLTPTPYVPPTRQSVVGKVKDDINTSANWLLEYVPEKIKKSVNEKLEALKTKVSGLFNKFGYNKPVEFKLTQSAIRGVTNQYTVEGKDGYDPQSFMNLVKKHAITILSDNLQTKANLVLTWSVLTSSQVKLY